jgi:hypothetical protein
MHVGQVNDIVLATSPRTRGESLHVKKPSLGALLLGLVPFVAMCFSVSLWDRVHPMILGIPFNLFWLLLWIVLTPLCMWAVYRIEVPVDPEAPHHHKHGRAR